ncbi:MAG TPA: rRNA (cytidine-2'-O-)-methyltransferase, partial [Cyanobacteria bacterium UBA11166]|nr:rRNA (cytidine-2'-O-)-methyltransferase [Cyanobacteria bacterium UBA11166]
EFWRGNLKDAIAYYQTKEPKGEFTLVVAGEVSDAPILSEDTLKEELMAIMLQGISRSQASRQLAQMTKISRRKLYQLALSLPAPSQAEVENIANSH